MPKPKEVKGFECPECSEFVLVANLNVGEDKQAEIAKHAETRYQCPECDAIHEDEHDAEDCCVE